MTADLTGLNENQSKAVLWEDGPLLVLAGPGSGKTRVLTLRVARLLESREDVTILALTFTTKAAAEMRERVDALLGFRGDRVRLSTFHSFATDILRQHGSHLSIRPDFNLLTQDEDRIALLEEPSGTDRPAGIARQLRELGHPVPRDAKQLLTLLDRLFSESYDGGPNAPSLASTPAWVPLLFRGYCDSLIRYNRLDFGSLLAFALRLLRDNKSVLKLLRSSWSHFCVDEFQDTNRAQYDLLRATIPDASPNLFVVGDDDQIIYQWNGASPERLQSLGSDYSMSTIQLPENYRCPSEVVDLANRLIVRNQLRTAGKQPLAANRKATLGDVRIRYACCSDPDDEAALVARDIKGRDLNPADCVVLARTTKILENVALALRASGFEAYIAQRKSDFKAPVVCVVIQALRLASARHDRDALRRLCVAWSALTGAILEVEGVAANAALFGGDFLKSWCDLAAQAATGEAADLMTRIQASLSERLEHVDIVDWFLDKGFSTWLEDADIELHEELNIWRNVHGDIVREHGREDLTLSVYLQNIDLAPKVNQPSSNAVRCLTVHGSKGLEFRHVYLVGMAQDVFPSFQALKLGQQSRELEEERRNCFVAITRVQETLTLLRARNYNGWNKGPSQFLLEMGLQCE